MVPIPAVLFDIVDHRSVPMPYSNSTMELYYFSLPMANPKTYKETPNVRSSLPTPNNTSRTGMVVVKILLPSEHMLVVKTRSVQFHTLEQSARSQNITTRGQLLFLSSILFPR